MLYEVIENKITVVFKLGKILAVGSFEPNHNHVELATVARSTWATKADYPYHSQISYYAMVTFDEHYIVFGGYGSG